MRRIEWRHYRILLAIQDSGSLTAAGKALGLTQSAASHQVKEAERRLGAELVARHGRSLRLTEAGEALAEAAATCAPLLLEAEAKARESTRGSRQRLRMGFGPQDGLSWVPAASDYLRQRDEAVQLDLIAAKPGQATNLLRRGEADLALEIGESAFAELRRSHICDEEMLCILPSARAAEWPDSNTSVTAQDINGETYFAHSLIPQAGFELEAFFQPAAGRPSHVAQIQSITSIIDLVAAGQGVSIQPRSVISAAVKDGRMIARSLAPKPLRQSWFLYARPDVLSRYGDSLLADLTETIAPHLQLA